jgi:TPP-dependent pyruvate/acetoin dehydrogenase alpha subunit
MGINNKKYKFYSSAIVAGTIPIALGVAKALKLKKKKNESLDFYWRYDI